MSRSLDHLFDRNVEWAASKTRNDPHFFRRMAEQQSPFYLWIGCSDSRVTANDVLGLEPGEVFVHRNLANIVHTSDLNILSVLEYAVDHLGIEHVIVCGHYGCGGIRRALSGIRSAMVDNWLQPVSMFHHKHRTFFDEMSEKERFDRMCEINVEMQVRRIAATPTVETAWERGQTLSLHGWIYAIEDGLLRDLGPHLSSIQERDVLPPIDDRLFTPSEAVSSAQKQALEAFSIDKLTDDGFSQRGCC